MALHSGSTQFEQDVLAADDARYKAMVAGDMPALERYLAGRLSYMHSTGFQEDRPTYVAALKTGKLRYRSVQRGATTVEQLSATSALVHGQVTMEVTLNGQDRTLDNLFLSVWVLQDDAWKMTAWTSVPRGK